MPSRNCLTFQQKAKLIKESLKPGFNRKKAAEEYKISRTTLYDILKNKSSILNYKNISEISAASGVVLDSSPKKEFNENFIKAKSLLELYK